MVNEEHDVDFIVNILDDSKLRNEMMKNNDFVAFETTNSDKNMQPHLKKNRRYFSDTIT